MRVRTFPTDLVHEGQQLPAPPKHAHPVSVGALGGVVALHPLQHAGHDLILDGDTKGAWGGVRIYEANRKKQIGFLVVIPPTLGYSPDPRLVLYIFKRKHSPFVVFVLPFCVETRCFFYNQIWPSFEENMAMFLIVDIFYENRSSDVDYKNPIELNRPYYRVQLVRET